MDISVNSSRNILARDSRPVCCCGIGGVSGVVFVDPRHLEPCVGHFEVDVYVFFDGWNTLGVERD